ncbi:MAG TPA: DALR anticodon-binding domain-containing protein, partial [Fimbriimonadaceae bacterium]|nr:DALR anticodon-binding domain-containing protein [Fimbriimonadaceae bacterium]
LSPQTGRGDSDSPTPQVPNSPTPQSTLWLRSTKFGDDMDRVLRRKDGRLTYIASDVAYHKDKFNRPENADKLITILGPDHHGYIGRLQAVLAAQMLGESQSDVSNPSDRTDPTNLTYQTDLYDSPEEAAACQAALAEARKKLHVQIYQLVRFMKDGKPAPMRKRDGNIYALIDLIDEIGKKVKPSETQEEQRKVGKDVARFFYLMRSHDTTFDFDLDLAERQSDENPVFYVQYAHARICSILKKAEGSMGGTPLETTSGTDVLKHPKELELIKKICDLPHEVQRCAEDYGVHRLTTYAIELARTFHHFYDACRVIQEDQPELTRARLALCTATRDALRSTFKLLGIEAPEKMER